MSAIRSSAAMILVLSAAAIPATGQSCVDLPGVSPFLLPNQTTLDVYVNASSPAPTGVSSADAEAAIRSAVATWNGALVGVQMVVHNGQPPASGPPAIEISFRNEARLFRAGPDGEMAFVLKEACPQTNRTIAHVFFNNTATFTGTNGFSTGGAQDATYDLELITLHELGHALGLGHYTLLDRIPPLMGPSLQTNAEVLGAGVWTLPELRRLFPEDQKMLAAVLQKRDALKDLAGTYQGQTKVTDVQSGSAISAGRAVPIHELILTPVPDGLQVTMRGTTALINNANLVLLANGKDVPKQPVAVENGAFFRQVRSLKPGSAPDKVVVSLRLHPLRHWVDVEGELSR